jgi:egghead protein (zeste-white 4 protein)
MVTTITVIFYAVQQYFWPHQSLPHSPFQEAWSWLGILWVMAFIPAMFELAGLLMWRAPMASAIPASKLVCWRVVSRGINKEALRDTILSIREEMRRTPLFPYVIEVLTDTDSTPDGLPPAAPDLHYIQVPRDYSTPNGTVNKARALNYALEYSPLADTAWIVHMDEETHPTPSGIIGVSAMIREEEASGRLRIGQGTITYHRDWKNHPFFTLSDCIRTGSDLGRLYLSMRIGAPLFGMHGSFIVIRNDVEKAMGFDVGPKGSLTEDAWWGTMAMDAGYRCRWVEGHMAEQCTHKIPDFIKQRRRWFNGMARTARSAPVSLKWRGVLSVSMLTWASAPVAWVYTIGHFADGGYVSPWIRALANISLAVYVATTLVGLQVNMKEHGITSSLQKIRWALTWLACLPVFSLMEAIAVAYAIVRPAKTFHVVKK